MQRGGGSGGVGGVGSRAGDVGKMEVTDDEVKIEEDISDLEE